MYDLRTTGDLAIRARAAARDLPGVIICRTTAAWLWGLDVLPPGVREQDWDVDLLAPGLALPRLPGIRIHRAAAREEYVVVDGIRITDPARTAVDCACTLSRYGALAALDAFARAGVSRTELRRSLHALGPASPGREQAADLVLLADPRAASPGESWARLLIIDAGLPTPEPQVAVPRIEGSFYLDLGFPAYRTAVEYDGQANHATAAELRHDRQRRTLIRASGWEVVVVRWHDVRAWPHRFLTSTYEVLITQGWRPPDAHRVEVEKRIRRIAVQARLDQGLR